MKRRGLSIMEAVLAFFLIAVALVTLYSTFAGSYRHSVMTRNRIAAGFLSTSFYEEVEAHPYGRPKPRSWPDPAIGPPKPTAPAKGWAKEGYPSVQSLPTYVEDRVVDSYYHRQLSLANGSFIGKGAGENWDEITVTITWEEVGDGKNPGGQKQLTSSRLVWRNNAVAP